MARDGEWSPDVVDVLSDYASMSRDQFWAHYPALRTRVPADAALYEDRGLLIELAQMAYRVRHP